MRVVLPESMCALMPMLRMCDSMSCSCSEISFTAGAAANARACHGLRCPTAVLERVRRHAFCSADGSTSDGASAKDLSNRLSPPRALLDHMARGRAACGRTDACSQARHPRAGSQLGAACDTAATWPLQMSLCTQSVGHAAPCGCVGCVVACGATFSFEGRIGQGSAK